MEIHSLLQANCEKLLQQYRANVEGTRLLQERLIADILPSVMDELQMNQDDEIWAREWLEDTCKCRQGRGQECLIVTLIYRCYVPDIACTSSVISSTKDSQT